MSTPDSGVTLPAPQDASVTGSRSVHRALEILTRVIENGPLPLTELARSSGLPTSTTLRMLRSLEHWQYVMRDAQGLYLPGMRFIAAQISDEPAGVEDLIDLSVPILQELTRSTTESSYLAVAGSANTCTYLREVQSTQPIRYVGFSGWTGRTVPLTKSAVGEVLYGRTPQSGYAVLDAVMAPEATVIAAPVHNGAGEVIAALSIVGPSFRMLGPHIKRLGPLVSAAADELGALL